MSEDVVLARSHPPPFTDRHPAPITALHSAELRRGPPAAESPTPTRCPPARSLPTTSTRRAPRAQSPSGPQNDATPQKTDTSV